MIKIKTMFFFSFFYTLCKELVIACVKKANQTLTLNTEYIGTWAQNNIGLLDFRPHFLITGTHVQTFLFDLKTWYLTRNSVKYERMFLISPAAARKLIALDWVYADDPCHFGHSELVVICPGIGGRSSDRSVLRLVKSICAYNKKTVNPYHVVVYNRATECTIPSYPDVEELDWVLQDLKRRGFKIHLVGLSAAGNLVLGYAGEKGNDCLVDSVIAAATTVDLVALRSKLVFNKDLDAYLYAKNGCWHSEASLVALEKSMMHSNYSSLYKYYESVTSGNVLKHITVPSLYITSKDDPLLDEYQINCMIESVKANSNMSAIVTSHGSHLDWVDGRHEIDWLTHTMLHFWNTGVQVQD